MDLKSGLPFSLIRYGLPYQYPALETSLKTDVVIIGGGISGALMAYHLLHAGIDCVVVDGRSVGLGSTCASTSLLQYEIDVSLTALSRKIGRKHAARAYTLCRQAIGKLNTIARKVKLAEFAFNKSLYYAAYKKDVAFLEAEFSLRKASGFRVELLSAPEIRKAYGFTAPAAICSDDGAYADAYLFTHHLLQYGIRNGLQVYDRTYISNMAHHRHGISLTTAAGHILRAKKVIYATGYEATEMIRKKIVSLHATYVTISEHMPDSDVIVGQDVMLWNTAQPYLYMRQTKEGRIIIGGRDEKFSNPARRDRLIGKKSKLLVRDFKKLFPATDFHAEFSWTGTFGSTADGLPFIGPWSTMPNSYFALGFGGNGITFSLIAAEIITGMLLGKKSKDAPLFSFDRV